MNTRFPFYLLILLVLVSCNDDSPTLEGSYHGRTTNFGCPTCFIMDYAVTMDLKNNAYTFQYVSDHVIRYGSYTVIGNEIIFKSTSPAPGPQGKYSMELTTNGTRFFRLEASGITYGFALTKD